MVYDKLSLFILHFFSLHLINLEELLKILFNANELCWPCEQVVLFIPSFKEYLQTNIDFQKNKKMIP